MMKVSNVYDRNAAANTRIVVNQGGTRSSKTYSICQLLIIRLLQEQGKVLTICRKTLPALRISVLRDFVNILSGLGLYNENDHNHTHNTYKLHGNLVEFVSMDEPQKKRGAKRDYLWMNEANELMLEDYRQLSLRTTKQIFIDFNPSDENHWIYDYVLPRPDCTLIHSTYKDNPFLEQAIIDEIENYKHTDENYWRVFGLGQRGISNTTIYTHWHGCNTLPAGGDTFYGLDFGYNVPTALVQVTLKDNTAYVRERLYQTKLTNADLIEHLKTLDIPKHAMLYADAAEPQRIEEIYRAGWHGIKPADKNVADGIRRVKQTALYISNDSVNLLKEIRNYKWQVDKNEQILDEPVKINDHLTDALRYAIATNALKPSGHYAIR